LRRLLLHAPNVHAGGGLRLLQSLLSESPLSVAWVQLDERLPIAGLCLGGVSVHAVKRRVFSRVLAELRLWLECRRDDVVLCFHGLPPVFPLRGRVVVFIQNRLLIDQRSLTGYPVAVRIRLRFERLLCRMLQKRCSRYIVQTPSMAKLLESWLRVDVPVLVSPFVPIASTTANGHAGGAAKEFDFVYVASGDPHKNHRNLLKAWCLLAEAGCRPSLGLTVDVHAYPGLCRHILRLSDKNRLSVTNLGNLSCEAVDALYESAAALIYPSTVESFGLPLIEASRHGLPILASELDYVRDVVTPIETFDPNSPISIARAVKRFLGNGESPVKIGTATGFLAEVLQ
jgi:glycosyltransferase involved in cell wall biosynthesis